MASGGLKGIKHGKQAKGEAVSYTTGESKQAAWVRCHLLAPE